MLFADGEPVNLLYGPSEPSRTAYPPPGTVAGQVLRLAANPRMRNSFILGGGSRPGRRRAGTPRGLYAAALGGGQVNPATGDFVFGVAEGYLIEDGRSPRRSGART